MDLTVQYFQKLQELVQRSLDAEQGCAWLKTKGIQEIAAFSLEEIYELLDAIRGDDVDGIKNELADLCYHLMIYASLAEQQGWFNLADVLQAAVEKINKRRFWEAENAEQAHQYWQQQKQQERQQKSSETFADIPNALPALIRSKKIQQRVAEQGFDWPNTDDVFAKLDEEIAELHVEVAAQDKQKIFDEMGDLLFTCVNLARHLDVDPEQALQHAQHKFCQRYTKLERMLEKDQQSLLDLEVQQILEYWQRAKCDN